MIKRWQQDQKGQAFVESAFIIPLLLLMVLGVVEVGWALRGYLIIANINREITRRAVKPLYLDFSERTGDLATDRYNVGYDENIIDNYFSTNSQGDFNMLPGFWEALNHDQAEDKQSEKAFLSMTYFVVRTGYPCDPDEEAIINGNWDCDCSIFETALTDATNNPLQAKAIYEGINQNFMYDDVIVHPGVQGYEYYKYFYVPPNAESADETLYFNTELIEDYESYENFAYIKAIDNAKFNCELLRKSPGESVSISPSNNNIIYSEMYYNQAQIFGFPIISNFVLDPIRMYTHTSMRLMPSVRDGLDSTTNGPICAPLPFLGDKTELDNALSSLQRDAEGNPINVFNGNPINLLGEDGEVEWIRWGSQDGYSDSEYLQFAFEYPQMAYNQGDEPLEVRRSISTWNPSLSDDEISQIEETIRSLAGQEMMVSIDTGLTGVAKVVIDSDSDAVMLTGASPRIMAYLVDGAASECFDTYFD